MDKKRFNPEKISPTFCILPWIHMSTRPNGHMRVCCTANASSAGATNDKNGVEKLVSLKMTMENQLT
ncbi:MAG: hypothetical protein MJK18_01235 [Bdellovibrionales bacterium]|nr:hypothetical protein [Bdellovibrionales bacterium]